jgi:hypothetical protein
MGSDIHAHLEYRIEDQWVCFCQEINLERNYQIFNSIVGIRGNGNCLIKAKGIPGDLSSGVFFQYNTWDEDKNDYVLEEDWHDPSWLTFDEYKLIWDKHCSDGLLTSQNWELFNKIFDMLDKNLVKAIQDLYFGLIVKIIRPTSGCIGPRDKCNFAPTPTRKNAIITVR